MTLRPRYSLLTLLVLTALVAGGVKLWRGPHHVVERSAQYMEHEYSYFRNMDGTRMIHGTRVDRAMSHDPQLSIINLSYYRQGQRLKFASWLSCNPPLQQMWQDPAMEVATDECDLTADELRDFQAVLDAEMDAAYRRGSRLTLYALKDGKAQLLPKK